jgi:uncharacterized protein
MSNPFVHVELHTPDLAKAKDFYGGLFGWKLEDMPIEGGGSYTMINVGEGTGGGMFACPDAAEPPHWLAYVGVDDVRAMTERAKKLGANVVQDVMEVPGYGWLCVFVDPTGAPLALWQAKPSQKE